MASPIKANLAKFREELPGWHVWIEGGVLFAVPARPEMTLRQAIATPGVFWASTTPDFLQEGAGDTSSQVNPTFG